MENLEEGHYDRENLDGSGQDKNFLRKQSDSHPRIIFLRKLYSSLLIQLLLISIISFNAYYFEDFKSALISSPIIFSVCLILTLLSSLAVLIFRRAMAKFPFNLIVYTFFSLTLAFSLACIVSYYNSEGILMLFTSPASVVFALLIYVFTTKYEISYQGTALFVFAALLFNFQMFLIYTEIPFNILMYILIAEAIFSFYLVYDTQTLISGTKYNWQKDDWISGAVIVYIDVFILIIKFCELIRQLIIRDRN